MANTPIPSCAHRFRLLLIMLLNAPRTPRSPATDGVRDGEVSPTKSYVVHRRPKNPRKTAGFGGTNGPCRLRRRSARPVSAARRRASRVRCAIWPLPAIAKSLTIRGRSGPYPVTRRVLTMILRYGQPCPEVGGSSDETLRTARWNAGGGGGAAHRAGRKRELRRRRQEGGASTGSGDLDAIAKARGLTPEDMQHALKQFVPPGKHDDYVMFSSGGHAGQVFAIGMPSMRLLKTIAVFTPEPWQGYGYGADWGDKVLKEGNPGRHRAVLGRYAPPRPQRDRRRVRRPLVVHQRPRERPRRHDRPEGLPHQAGARRPQHPDVPRRHVRHTELRVRPRLIQVPGAVAARFVRRRHGVSGEVPRRICLAEDRSRPPAGSI